MKLHQNIAFFILSLFLLCMNTAQGQLNPPRNSDGSIDKENVIKEFNLYVRELNKLPATEEEIHDAIKYFNDQLFPYPSEIKIRDDRTNADEVYTAEEQKRINDECYDELYAILKETITKASTSTTSSAEKDSDSGSSFDWRIAALIACCVLLVVLIVLFVRLISKDKKPKTKKTVMPANKPTVRPTNNEEKAGIVVKRMTQAVMRRQSLDGVEDDGNYMMIDCHDFCTDSSVKRLFIKNACIKSIYNMYAEDLRNPNNPKEDGCMVLGRWVHDNTRGEYDISLEDVVFPGDDAVFSEYELNFGFKISHTVGERLKKLRRETDCQYDLTCWVHSHPGLGVFFSNSDCNVQSQLKHPTHPNLLIAIVIDILTPQQDLGIFTFKHDGSINTKTELKKLYSLEEWYQWALKSERNSFKQEDHFDTLSNAKMRVDSCYSIQLSNSTIIDMSLLSPNSNGELVSWIHGFTNHQGERVANVAIKVSKTDKEADNELIGAFVMAAHCSIPSIRKAIASHIERINFVLVYSTSNGKLTSIPIINNNLCTDDNCYGEQNLEDLKIWTRRKR